MLRASTSVTSLGLLTNNLVCFIASLAIFSHASFGISTSLNFCGKPNLLDKSSNLSINSAHTACVPLLISNFGKTYGASSA